jgi:hypothetical protein
MTVMLKSFAQPVNPSFVMATQDRSRMALFQNWLYSRTLVQIKSKISIMPAKIKANF